MNIFKELAEVGDSQLKLKNLTDNILDMYKKNPNESKKLLIELNSINEELEDLEEEYTKLQNEIY